MKIISVWGNPGAGKSLVACAFAQLLTRKGNVILISADRITPMLPVFLPFEEEKPDYSIGRLLAGAVTEERLKHTVRIHPQNNHLAFMGLISGENGLTYQTGWHRDSIGQLMQYFESHDLADYIVFDNASDILSDVTVTLYALERANSVIQVISPDTRGIAFLDAQFPILKTGNFNTEHVRVLNNCYAYSPVEKIQADYGIPFALPHSRSVYSKYSGGELLTQFDDSPGIQFERVLQKNIYEKVMDSIE